VRAGVNSRFALVAAVVVLGLTGAGCAYYNTFYSARKSFELADRQMQQQPDPEARATAGAAALFDKAIQGSTKVVLEYAGSKWVDDAVLLIGRSQLGKGEYAGAQLKFAELGQNFPGSNLLHEAVYWSGVAAERDRRRPEAIVLFDSLLTHFPDSRFRDQAKYRRANLYLLAREPAKAEADLRELSRRKDKLGYDAGLRLADALYAAKRFEEARGEYERVAERAPTEMLRQDARLRVGDCDEALGDRAAAARTYEALLREARTPDGKARARLRYGSALGMSGQVDRGIGELQNVIDDQPRTPYAAEAAFRAGYLHEVVRDDAASARRSYDTVAEQQPGSPFVAQAKMRRDNLDRLDSFRAATGDSAGADAGAQALFQSGELLLFQLGKPQKAIEEYARLEREYPDSPLVPRAVFAQGWVKARRLGDIDGAKDDFQRLVARWPDSPVTAQAQRLLANPADSTIALTVLPPTSLTFPLVPGNALYVAPPPAPRSAAKAAGGAAAKAPADSLRLRAAGDSAAAALRTVPMNAARDSLYRARADSIRAAQRARTNPPATDTTRNLER
jgi:TolA-binding protein